MQKSALILTLILTFQTQAQVVDVNGDDMIDLSDALTLLYYLLPPGPGPAPSGVIGECYPVEYPAGCAEGSTLCHW